MNAPQCTCLPLVTCDRCEREAMDLSPAEAATVARFDAAPDESLRERVARAICEVEDGIPWDDWTPQVHDTYRLYADAAIAVMRGDDD